MSFIRLHDNEYYENRFATRIQGVEYEVATKRVIFGWRVVVYHPGKNSIMDFQYYANWCCGDNISLIQLTHRLLRDCLDAGIHPTQLPYCSDIKPWINDDAFVKKITALGHAIIGTFPDIDKLKPKQPNASPTQDTMPAEPS